MDNIIVKKNIKKSNKKNLFNTNTRLKDDNCYQKLDVETARKPGELLTETLFNDCPHETNYNLSIEQKGLYFRDGHGISACFIDNDSHLRNGPLIVRDKQRTQLPASKHLFPPYLSRGISDTNTESNVIHGLVTREKKDCDSLSEIVVDRFEELHRNVQDVNNVVPQFPRSGIDTRNIFKKKTCRNYWEK